MSPSGTVLGTYPVGTSPISIAFDGYGNAWVTNRDSNNVTALSSTGQQLGLFNAGSGPYAVAIDAARNAWVTNTGSNNVSVIPKVNPPSGTVLYQGFYPGYISCSGPAFDSQNCAWFLMYRGSSPYFQADLLKFSSNMQVLASYSITNQAVVNMASRITTDSMDRLVLGCQTSVCRYSATGQFIASASVPSASSIGSDVLSDSQNNIWMSSGAWWPPSSNEVIRFSADLQSVATYSIPGSYSSTLSGENFGCFDNQGNLLVNTGRCVDKVTSTGTVIGSYRPNELYGASRQVCVDQNNNAWVLYSPTWYSGNYYVPSVAEFGPNGAEITSFSIPNTFTNLGNMPVTSNIGIDLNGYLWIGDRMGTSLVKVNTSGAVIGVYNIGGGDIYLDGPYFDRLGAIWATHVDNAGVVLYKVQP